MRLKDKRGQVLIEVLLMLPVFLLLVFSIMEIGHLAFRTILLHHAAYEVARIGSLTAFPMVASPSCSQPKLDDSVMDATRAKILPRSYGVYTYVPSLEDPQDCCDNFDLIAVVSDNVPMIFPMTGFVLGNANGKRARKLTASVRMPIERPLFGKGSC